MKRCEKSLDVGLLILRLSLGLLMLLHGIAKIPDLSGIKGLLLMHGLPSFIAYGVLVGEVLAPIALIIGFRTRIAALIFAINCIVALLLAHAGDVFTMSGTGGWALELLGLYMFGSVALFFTGGGNLSISKKNMWD